MSEDLTGLAVDEDAVVRGAVTPEVVRGVAVPEAVRGADPEAVRGAVVRPVLLTVRPVSKVRVCRPFLD